MRDAANRDRHVRRVIVIEGLANVVVLAIKTWAGLVTGSLAILGDALHSLTDVFNNVMAWFIIRFSAKPPDHNHPYGHRKFEALAVFILATLLVVLSFELALNALRRDAEAPTSSPLALVVMLVVLAINIALTVWQRYWASRIASDILRADADHTLADVLTTLVVIVGWQLSARGFPWLDMVCALGVAGLVMYLAWGLFRRVLPALVDEKAVEPESFAASIAAVSGVREVRRVRTRLIGDVRAADVVVAVDDALSVAASHEIADRIELAVEQEFGVEDITIHVEPIGKT
ncbi:MAG: cation diffusion facilitator family transporter [Pseudomonadota bacterium]